jgi:type IV pilus assembly protein PilY1
MRFHIHRNVAAASAGIALLASASSGRAQLQLDTNPPAPNVMLLLDNSGSMERMIDSNLPEIDGNPCNYDMNGKAIPTAVPPQPNRWGTVIQALTGTFENNVYNCIDMPRASGGQFTKEYQIGGAKPYDADYYIDYHRPVFLDSSTSPPTACVIAPGALPGAAPGTGVGQTGAGSGSNGPGAGQAATDFPPDGIILRPFTQWNTVVANPATGPCSQFPNKQYSSYQYQDGAIPSSTSEMRFGLMTFDQDPSPSIGVTTGANPTVVGSTFVDPLSTSYGAFAGMWSYFLGWNTGAACTHTGMPIGCTTPQMLAVGARNPAAPPWEGRMMPFPLTDDLATQETNNQNIASVVLATRPYGATPLAGMLQDAEDYFYNDANGPQKKDPLVSCGSRPEYIILLTDGAPNLDMRPLPPPENTGGCVDPNCPFRTPDAIAAELNSGTSGALVTTYVIGFAVSSATNDQALQQCATLAASGTLASVCSQATPPATTQAQACCALEKIALAGSANMFSNNIVVPNPKPTSAFFADTPGALQKALADILANIAQHATTRTTPAYAAATASQSVYADPNSPTTVGAKYLASFNPSPGNPMTGDIVRTRNVCSQSMGNYSVAPVFDPIAGDDFGANLNSNSGNARTFIAFQPDATGGVPAVDATATIRPYVSTAVVDGLGKYSATTYAGVAGSVIPSITPAALGISQPYPYNSSATSIPVTPGLTPAQAATMTLDYTFGQQSFTGNPGNFPFVSRYGRALGGIYHAAPAIVGPPGTLIQDPGYSGFQNTWQGRDGVAYVATTDGLLHAFWTDETRLENNERWAMLLPAVMPSLNRSYPSSPDLLLDGSPIVKDVAWERTIASSSDPTLWHTMLVAGYGPSNRGYYAVDVTNPDASHLTAGTIPPDAPGPPGAAGSGPHFRWQLTKMPTTNYAIFGAQSATPAITTLFMDPGDGAGAREIAVAILPGGVDGAPTSSAGNGPSCARASKAGVDSQPIGGYLYRGFVRCWGSTQKWDDPVNGRALAIVRVDTGEILRVFERLKDAQSAPADTLIAANRINDTPLDSPMTGTPLVYPGDVATDATKVFVSDADGTIWRFDLSNSDPSKWTGTLFLDLYNQTVDFNATAWSDGQPVTVAPTLSTDTSGEVVINAATGVTDAFDSNGVEFLYSITEKVQGTTATSQQLRAFVNWYMATPLTPPPAMSGFSYPSNPENTATTPAAFYMGERVAGPMVVFNGTLYFATYIVPPSSTPSICPSSFARVWGVDFVKPADGACASSPTCNRALGGAPALVQGALGTPPVTDVTPLTSATDIHIKSAVIPGVTIDATPACAGAGAAANDQYVGGGAQHSAPQGMSKGNYAISAQVGAQNPNGVGAASVSINVPAPLAPTVIDSWAAVLE